MNNALEIILTRRSIRKFKQCEINPDLVQLILKAAMSAPSACNQNARHYIVVSDPKDLQALSMIHSGMAFMAKAPLAIIVCGEPSAAILEPFWMDDCAATTQNLLLAAHALNLGATWVGVNHAEAGTITLIRNILKLPESVVPFSLVPLGEPAETREAFDRFLPERVHYHQW